MSLHDQLHTAFVAYITRGHPRPTKIYLGGREFRILTNALLMDPVQVQQVAGYPPRRTFQGMEVFMVNADTHIGFSD